LPGKFDAVVYGPARTANSDLIEALEAAGTIPFTTAGDCVAPRISFSVSREGYDAADRLAAILTRKSFEAVTRGSMRKRIPEHRDRLFFWKAVGLTWTPTTFGDYYNE
jgi:hypothetical protein